MRNLIFLSLIIFAGLLAQTNALACGCPSRLADNKMAVDKYFNQASIVFAGKVVFAKFLPIFKKNTSGNYIKAENLVFKFTVDNWWKGKPKREIIINTSQFKYPSLGYGEGSGCEFLFETGKRYLVYANRLNGQLIVDECSGTTSIERAEKDIEKLQQLKSK